MQMLVYYDTVDDQMNVIKSFIKKLNDVTYILTEHSDVFEDQIHPWALNLATFCFCFAKSGFVNLGKGIRLKPDGNISKLIDGMTTLFYWAIDYFDTKYVKGKPKLVMD